jgi:predicted nucleic acid-binding protein
MLYEDTCVLLAALTPEAHSGAAAAFLEQATAPLAISPSSTTELHSALALKVCTKALSPSEAEAMLQAFERSLTPAFLMLEVEPQDFRNASTCLRGLTTALRAADAKDAPDRCGKDPPCRQSAGLLKEVPVPLNPPFRPSRHGARSAVAR